MELPVLNVLDDRPAVGTLRFRLLQLQGKIRRYIRANVYTKDNEKMLARRQGDCNRCGACCMILVRCPFLDEVEGEYTCQIHGEHFEQCRIFPLEARDLEEVEADCSYHFDSH